MSEDRVPFIGSVTIAAGVKPEIIELRIMGEVPNAWQHLVLQTLLTGVAGMQSVVWDRDLHELSDLADSHNAAEAVEAVTTVATATITIADPAQRETLIATLQSVIESVMFLNDDYCIVEDIPAIDDLDSLRERLLSVDGVSHVLAVNLLHGAPLTRIAILYQGDSSVEETIEEVLADVV
ncbi:MAG TPA: hypothetical protein VLF91_05310 [Candidatus Saccharimonadales bacterium]|nr:hypothetical protein [Candidatus Saccharimonadales bacterium]